jgi:hypothetical protein
MVSMKRIRAVGLVVLALSVGNVGPALTQESWLPVTLDYDPPPEGLAAGQETTTTFTLTATTDIPVLEVSVAPMEGLVVVGGDRSATFEAVAKGERRQLTVRIRLTADAGKLSLVMRARFGKQMFGKAVLVKYGKAAAAEPRL